MSQWQPKIGGEPGERVEGLDALEQQLRIVLETPLASVPSRPGFGTKLFELLDEPVTTMKPAMVKEVLRTTAVNLPNLKVLAVEQGYSDAGRVEVAVKWQPVDESTAPRTTTVTL